MTCTLFAVILTGIVKKVPINGHLFKCRIVKGLTMNLREGTKRHLQTHRVWLEPSYEYVRSSHRRKIRRERHQANARFLLWICFTSFAAVGLMTSAIFKLLKGLT